MALARRVGEVRNVAASISVLHSHRRCSSGTPLPSLNPLAEELVSTHGVPESSRKSDLALPSSSLHRLWQCNHANRGLTQVYCACRGM